MKAKENREPALSKVEGRGSAGQHQGGAMKKGWQTKTLGDVCDFEGGSQPPKSEFIYDEKPGYVRFLQIHRKRRQATRS